MSSPSSLRIIAGPVVTFTRAHSPSGICRCPSEAVTSTQTRWFQALVLGAALSLLWVGYVARLRQLSRDYQRRLDERVNERTRIVRDLHDTLLQSFHGLLLKFQTVSYLLPEPPAEATDCAACPNGPP